MTRVLLLIKTLDRGGAEALLLSASRFFDRSKFHYEVAYLIPEANALVGDLEDGGLTVTCLGGSRGVRWVGRLRDLVRAHRIDIVHVHSPYVAIGARLGLMLRRKRPILVYTEHNTWVGYRVPTRWGNALTYFLNDYVLAVSEEVRGSVRIPRPLRRLGVPSVETLYHGIDPDRIQAGPDGVRAELGIPPEAPVVGTVGNLRIHKGHIYAIRAIARVRRDLPGVRLVLVGKGPRETYLRREVERLGLSETVLFTGSRPDAPRLTAAFDLFAVPSYEEGLSIALIEAMSLGKASVVTRVGGLPEVIREGTEGLFVRPRDPDELARGMLTLLTDDALRKRMGEAARERAARFHICGAVERMEEIYGGLAMEAQCSS